MAGGREIKTKIKSVQNTRKVTRALEMVSASKIRKAQDRMKGSRPYARLMTQLIGHIAKANSEYTHPFMADHGDIKRVGYIIVSTDRGLAGGLNSSMFRKILAEMREWNEKGVEIDLVCIGQKAATFFRRLNVNMLASVTHLGEKPHLDQLIGVVVVPLIFYRLLKPIAEWPVPAPPDTCAGTTRQAWPRSPSTPAPRGSATRWSRSGGRRSPGPTTASGRWRQRSPCSSSPRTSARAMPTGRCCRLSSTPCSCLQATVQAWQPMQVRWSIAKPYCTQAHFFRMT